jgi:hypothetical protein
MGIDGKASGAGRRRVTPGLREFVLGGGGKRGVELSARVNMESGHAH